MVLTAPKIPYLTIRNSLVELFRNNFSSLNEGLTGGTFSNSPVAQIKAGDPFTTVIPNTLYPVILVKLITKTEDFAGLGAGGHKRPEITYRIFGITRLLTSSETADDESIILAQNIEGLLRNNITFDSNILYSQPTLTDFAVGEAEGTFVSLVSVDLVCWCQLE